MANICQITGKRIMVGNRVSHANNRSKRRFYPNLMKKTFYIPEEDRNITLTVSTTGLRTISKIGIYKALKKAREKGYFTK